MKPWAIFFGLFIIGVIILADLGRLGGLHGIYDIPYGDKVGHFTLYGLLGFVLDLSVFEARPLANKKSLAVITSLILIAVIGLEEISQIWIPTRTADVFDWLAGCAGVIFFAWLAYRVKK
jgi:polysaccharide biosynthesis protein VpsQ